MKPSGKALVYAASTCNNMKLSFRQTELSISGWSLSTIATGYRVDIGGKKTTFLLDAGVVIDLTNIKHFVVFITHDHSDHWSQIHIHFHPNSPIKPIVFVPKNMIDYFSDFLTSKVAISARRKVDINELCILVPVLSGDEFYLQETEMGTVLQTSQNIEESTAFKINIIDCDHGTECVGYCVTEYKDISKMSKKVRPDVAQQLSQFKGKAYGDELRKLINTGFDVYESMQREQKLFVFLGDTTPKVYQDFGRLIQQYPICFSECTFWSPENMAEAPKRFHTHWTNLWPILQSMQQTIFILGHFSQRETRETIMECVEEYKKTNQNIIVIYPERYIPDEPKKYMCNCCS
jgi:ribonuclease BN (tRNA processing enzyme)